MIRTLLVGTGGFLGAIARYGLGGLIHRWTDTLFPAGTLAVNTVGCLVIGVLMSLVEDRQLLTPNVRVFLMIGVLGGFTTFSSFGYETVELMRHGALRLVFWNVAGNVLLGLAAVLLGWGATRALLS